MQQKDNRFADMMSRYNLGNMVRAMADPSFHGAGLEVEVGQELARQHPAKVSGMLIPFDALTRGLTVGDPYAGGHTVATELHANRFIEMLRPVSVVANLGAKTLSGLAGKVAIPRQTASTAAYWVAENGEPTESQPAFDQINMQPRTLGAFSDISRRMLLQSSLDISSFVAADLRASLAQELDRACLAGSGTDNEPVGLLNISGIQTKALGTDGAAIDWDDLIDMETEVMSSNADGSALAYLMAKPVRGYLLKTKNTNGDYYGQTMWQPASKPQLSGEGVVNGYRAVASSLLPADLTKGSGTGLSSMIFGNWSDLMIGQWGAGIDITIDPYTHATTGAVRIIAMTDVDFAVRHPESFILVKDIAL